MKNQERGFKYDHWITLETDYVTEIKFDKIERESVTDKVVAALRSRILSGDLSPGTRLIESQLASQLGVSRAPVREAFRTLEREGLVVADPGEPA